MTRYTCKKHSTIPVLPVFSNIGEPINLSKLIDREKKIVIFGSKIPRIRVYRDSLNILHEICLKFNITEILDIGPPLEFKLEPINGIEIKILGIKTPEEISSILANTMIGFINYPTGYFVKSGIFAAYCSHRVLIVATPYEEQEIDSVLRNIHYWIDDNLQPLSLNQNEAQTIADNAHQWYQGHNLKAHAQTFFRFI
jgi:hypothetical protein